MIIAERHIPTRDVRPGHTIWSPGFRSPVELDQVGHRAGDQKAVFVYRYESSGRVRTYRLERALAGTTTIYKEGPSMRTDFGLHCNGHPGPHQLRLTDHIGGTGGQTVADVAAIAITHAFTGDDEDQAETTRAAARAVLDRAIAGETGTSDEEAAALIAAVTSGREYMLDNHYDADDTFPDDAAAARALALRAWVDICWAR